MGDLLWSFDHAQNVLAQEIIQESRQEEVRDLLALPYSTRM
jgi:hypothetical protein